MNLLVLVRVRWPIECARGHSMNLWDKNIWLDTENPYEYRSNETTPPP